MVESNNSKRPDGNSLFMKNFVEMRLTKIHVNFSVCLKNTGKSAITIVAHPGSMHNRARNYINFHMGRLHTFVLTVKLISLMHLRLIR